MPASEVVDDMIHVKEKRVSKEFEWFQAMGFTALWCPPGYQGETRCVGWGVLVLLLLKKRLRLVREIKEKTVCF